MVRTATLALQVGILAFSGSALAQAEDGGPAVVVPDDWTTPPAVPDDWTTLLAVPTNQQLVPCPGPCWMRLWRRHSVRVSARLG